MFKYAVFRAGWFHFSIMCCIMENGHGKFTNLAAFRAGKYNGANLRTGAGNGYNAFIPSVPGNNPAFIFKPASLADSHGKPRFGASNFNRFPFAPVMTKSGIETFFLCIASGYFAFI